MLKKKKIYRRPILTQKKVKPNFFYTQTATDGFNLFGHVYIASGHSECCCGDVVA